MRILAYMLITLITACATHSGVMQMGPNTYTLSVGISGQGSITANDAKAKREALTEANNFCSSKKRQLLVKNFAMNSTISGSTQDLIFQCLTDEEAAIAPSPTYQKDPNIVIQHRN